MAETLGSLVDKLSIVNNKLWHQEEIAHEEGADDHTVAKAKRQVNILNTQRNDLIQEIDEYLVKILSGEITHKVFYQLKDYSRRR